MTTSNRAVSLRRFRSGGAVLGIADASRLSDDAPCDQNETIAVARRDSVVRYPAPHQHHRVNQAPKNGIHAHLSAPNLAYCMAGIVLGS
jgi:hypothetical protein